jgi:hypothetical protein
MFLQIEVQIETILNCRLGKYRTGDSNMVMLFIM